MKRNKEKDANFMLNNIVSEEDAKEKARKILEEYGFKTKKLDI